jgi:hypothetical protein
MRDRAPVRDGRPAAEAAEIQARVDVGRFIAGPFAARC